MKKYIDIKIKTKNPELADKMLQNWGILMQMGYPKDKDGNYPARSFTGQGAIDFAKFAIKNQGYQDIEIINQ